MTSPAQSVQRDAVSPLELFFDLVFVFAVSQLSHHLLDHLTWRGAAETLVLLIAVFGIWSGTSFEATLLNIGRSPTQWMLLAVMLAGLFMNAAIADAFDTGGWVRAPARQPRGPSPATGRSGVRGWCSTRLAGASRTGSTPATPISCWLPERAGRFPSACCSMARLRPGTRRGCRRGRNGLLRDGRLYQLVREHDAVRERTLEITFLEPGAEAYVFTFG